jgi:predicted NAD-dependent protein-ADP-ribosyltransferase YbiA (DUF1768 family)
MDRIYYYSRSKDVPPGKGVHEHISNIDDYRELAKISNFRKILSNFHEYPFIYNGYSYNSIEHTFQSEKIRLVDNDVAYRFTIDSGDSIGKGNGLIARKNRKIIVMEKRDILKWDKIKHGIITEITRQKIKQCKIFRDTLKATNNSQLWHIVMRSKPVRNLYLENLRSEILSLPRSSDSS